MFPFSREFYLTNVKAMRKTHNHHEVKVISNEIYQQTLKSMGGSLRRNRILALSPSISSEVLVKHKDKDSSFTVGEIIFAE